MPRTHQPGEHLRSVIPLDLRGSLPLDALDREDRRAARRSHTRRRRHRGRLTSHKSVVEGCGRDERQVRTYEANSQEPGLRCRDQPPHGVYRQGSDSMVGVIEPAWVHVAAALVQQVEVVTDRNPSARRHVLRIGPVGPVLAAPRATSIVLAMVEHLAVKGGVPARVFQVLRQRDGVGLVLADMRVQVDHAVPVGPPPREHGCTRRAAVCDRGVRAAEDGALASELV
eukprot:scaffold8918_cov59-Phaeocystis_antarctica.AAC.7